MSAQPKKSTTENDILNLRDHFKQCAYKSNQTAQSLEEQARNARREAQDFLNQAQVMDQAYQLLMKQNTLSTAAAQLDDLDAKDLAKIAKRRFVFLIDGSGSMQGAPLDGSLTAAQTLAQKINAAGGAVESYIFGNKDPVKIDVTDESQRQLIRKGLNSGTDMAPAIIKATETLKKTQFAHIVIFSDGDFFDKEASEKAITDMLVNFPKVTLDALQIGGINNSAASGYPPRSLQSSFQTRRASNLEQFFAGMSGGTQKLQFTNVSSDIAPMALGEILASRLQTSAAKPDAKTKQKPPTLGK